MPVRSRAMILVAALVAAAALPAKVGAQTRSGAEVLRLAAGESHLVTRAAPLTKVSIADPAIADVVVVSATELVVNGKVPGTTSLMLWDNAGGRAHFAVRVSPDAETLEEDLARLFPDEEIRVETSGATVILSGTVSSAQVAERAEAIAGSSFTGDVEISNQLVVPDPGQVLLQVRFAEVSKSGLERAGVNILHWDPDNISAGSGLGRPTPLDGAVGLPPTTASPTQELSDAVNLFLLAPDADVAVFIQALKSQGLFRSLAEPNLLALHGDSASFLAGGEFPFPVVQGGNNAGAVTIQFREFGVRLGFRPEILPGGNIRLSVAPEVSSLDFANGLTLSGFTVPTILIRRAATTLELRDGQTFAIAGLIDNSQLEDIDKVPILGDIPILGSLFRSKELRQNRSELLVIVTPRLLRPSDGPIPVPTGEPETWDWMNAMQSSPSETATERTEAP